MFTFEEHIQKLAEFGHVAQLTGTYNTKDYPDGMVLSDDPKNSHITPAFISVPDVQTLKSLCGIHNEMASETLLTEGIPESPELLDYEVNNPLDEHVCNALNTFIYGNSEQVAAWEGTLNKLRFPMQVAVFTADTIVVSAGKPLYIGEEGGKPVNPTLGNVVIEPGGQIIARNSGVVTINSLSSQGVSRDFERLAATATDPAQTITLVSVGGDGGKGGDGGNGSTNPNPGSKGADATENGKSGCNAAVIGGKGPDGGNASTTTGRGGDGNPANPINYNVSEMNGNYIVGSIGGNGGPGGKGGNGGNGSPGGAGGAACRSCQQASQGPGGKGGNAGPGGRGGDGGPGAKVYVNYTSGSPNISVSNLKANGGGGGAAGSNGSGGQGVPPGDNGATALPGDGGNGGTAGQVIINGIVTN
ncbi:MAG: hypothetical protein J0L99_13475 [Chitinophagales bacterium]|nr:hypothetical protein [Chitinophagales bacterium]